MWCVGLTLWAGGLSGITRFAPTGTFDLISGNSQETGHETFRGRDRSRDRVTVVFDDRYTLDGAKRTVRIDAPSVGGTGGLAGVRGSMTFVGTDNVATGFGLYSGVLELRRAAR
jgi:hypothetical protein